MTIKQKLSFSILLGTATLAVTSAAASESLASLKAQYERPDSIPENPGNPLTPESIELGKALFFDPRLSSSGLMSCASCHNPSFNWEDGLALATGNEHKKLGRSTPTILNAAWNEVSFWDGRAETLEEQALGPIEASGEMNMPLDEMLEVLRSIPGYETKFERAYPEQGISLETVAKALANFQRTIVSGEAPFDRWIQGEEDAISKDAIAGFELFNGKAACVKCHSGWNFTDSSFHDIGVLTQDKGRGGFLGFDSMNHTFKTPNLRNIEGRAPYMHNGSERTLEDVVQLYNEGGRTHRDTLSPDIRPLHLNESEVRQIIAFLKTLTSDDQEMPLPLLPSLYATNP